MSLLDAWRGHRHTRRYQRNDDDDREILHILTTRGPAHAWTIRQDAGFRSARVHRALTRLMQAGLVRDHWDDIPGHTELLHMYRATTPTETTP